MFVDDTHVDHLDVIRRPLAVEIVMMGVVMLTMSVFHCQLKSCFSQHTWN